MKQFEFMGEMKKIGDFGFQAVDGLMDMILQSHKQSELACLEGVKMCHETSAAAARLAQDAARKLRSGLTGPSAKA